MAASGCQCCDPAVGTKMSLGGGYQQGHVTVGKWDTPDYLGGAWNATMFFYSPLEDE